MTTKINIFAFSLVALLSLSVFAIVANPIAFADDDDKDEKELKVKDFKKKADFTADCAKINTGVETDWSCEASFWLDKKGENLRYQIQIKNMDLTGWQTVGDTTDDVGKVHLHSAADDNAHVLNVWKAPIEDDAQMTAYPTEGILRGNYDDSDITTVEEATAGGIGHHDTSKPLTANLDDLCNGDFFVMIHEAAGPGVLKGFLDPTKHGDKICKKLGF